MGSVMIHCPKTKMPISTGIGMGREMFEASEFETMSVTCPLCGGTHEWSKEDAFVLDDEEKG